MAWVVLFAAGLLEVGWAVSLKYAKGFTAFWPSAGFVAFMAASVYLLGTALKSLPLGTAYTVWTGIGAIGTVAFGIFAFGEPADPRRLACTALILVGIVGLKYVSPHGNGPPAQQSPTRQNWATEPAEDWTVRSTDPLHGPSESPPDTSPDGPPVQA